MVISSGPGPVFRGFAAIIVGHVPEYPISVLENNLPDLLSFQHACLI